MKNFTNCLILIIALAFIGSVKAQSNPSVINDSTGAWRVNYINDNGTGGNYFSHDHFRYTFNGDTLINGQSWHKLFKGGHSWDEDFFGGTTSNHNNYSGVYSGAIHEDNGKWFYYGSSDLQPEAEYLLYDFNLNTGDYLPETFNNAAGNLYVSAIDTVLISNIERRRFFIQGNSGPGVTCIIEGIGSNVGLIEPLQQFEPIWYLVCYAENGEAVWNDGANECDLTVNTQSMFVEPKGGIIVSPNPFKSNAVVRFPEIRQTGGLLILDMKGRALLTYTLADGQSELEIQPDLNAGIYLLRINEANRIQSRKFVVQ
jgi:hypothetical protein